VVLLSAGIRGHTVLSMLYSLTISSRREFVVLRTRNSSEHPFVADSQILARSARSRPHCYSNQAKQTNRAMDYDAHATYVLCPQLCVRRIPQQRLHFWELHSGSLTRQPMVQTASTVVPTCDFRCTRRRTRRNRRSSRC